MRSQLIAGLRAVMVFTVLVGIVYPLAVTGLAQLTFKTDANGSLVRDQKGVVVGSRLIGQSFTGPEWFHPRPSAAGAGYDTTASGASNLGPTNKVLLEQVAKRTSGYRNLNGLKADQEVPVDAVTSSGSGLDPHISVANARLQSTRVAQARHLDLDSVNRLIDEHTDLRGLGFLGEAGVNVLSLNMALDAVE